MKFLGWLLVPVHLHLDWDFEIERAHFDDESHLTLLYTVRLFRK